MVCNNYQFHMGSSSVYLGGGPVELLNNLLFFCLINITMNFIHQTTPLLVLLFFSGFQYIITPVEAAYTMNKFQFYLLSHLFLVNLPFMM